MNKTSSRYYVELENKTMQNRILLFFYLVSYTPYLANLNFKRSWRPTIKKSKYVYSVYYKK